MPTPRVHETPPKGRLVSSGTASAADLLPVFAAELIGRSEPENDSRDLGLLREVGAVTDFDSFASWDLLSRIMDALRNYAPEGTYFGSYADGEYGFWLDPAVV